MLLPWTDETQQDASHHHFRHMSRAVSKRELSTKFVVIWVRLWCFSQLEGWQTSPVHPIAECLVKLSPGDTLQLSNFVVTPWRVMQSLERKFSAGTAAFSQPGVWPVACWQGCWFTSYGNPVETGWLLIRASLQQPFRVHIPGLWLVCQSQGLAELKCWCWYTL